MTARDKPKLAIVPPGSKRETFFRNDGVEVYKDDGCYAESNYTSGRLKQQIADIDWMFDDNVPLPPGVEKQIERMQAKREADDVAVCYVPKPFIVRRKNDPDPQ